MKTPLDIKKVDARLATIYTDDGDKLAKYDRWAGQYETDLRELGYVAHLRAAEVFARVVGDKTLRVLDLGCGTGLVGEVLAGKGYTRLDGADFSQEMLVEAGRRRVYRNLFQRDVTRESADQLNYDALISVGLFSFGAPHITDLHNAVNCVAPGGVCVITINGAAWESLDLAPAVQRESDKYGFVVEEIVETEYLVKEGIDAKVLVIRRG